MPLLVSAFEHSAAIVRDVPPGGLADESAQLQCLPNLVRLNLIQLVGGVNASEQNPQITRKGSPNNGLWLGLANTSLMTRVYKYPSRYPIRPSGIYQERLIKQERFRQMHLQPDLGMELSEPQLDALLLWQSKGFDLVAAYVVIPNGWGADNRIIELARREISLPNSIEELAQFPGSIGPVTILGGELPIIAEGYDAELENIGLKESQQEEDGTFEGANEPLGPLPKNEQDRK